MSSSPRAAQRVSLRSLFPHAVFTAGDDIEVSSCSRRPTARCAPSSGHLYVAGIDSLSQNESDASAAIAKGAQAILSERLLPIPVPQCLVGDVRQAYGELVHALAEQPSQKLITVGVMGTHGKTSVSLLVASMLKRISGGVAYWTSEGIYPARPIAAQSIPAPSAKNLVGWMSRAVDQKMPAVVMELSHSMLLQRTAAGVEFDVLIVPSFRKTQRHDRLESRGIETAMLRSIDQLKDHGLVVYNADDARLNRLVDRHQLPALGYGLDADAEVRGKRIERHKGEQTMMVCAGRSLMPLTTKLDGDHNLRHNLAAVAVGYAFGLDLHEVVGGAEQLIRIPGRMQSLHCGQDFSVHIDVADQADRLAVALHSLAQLGGRVTCVAEVPDCADSEQRAAYGRVLNRAASRVILTQSRWTTKQGQRYMWEVVDGCDHPASIDLIPDRTTAIELALRSAAPGEQVLLAGWGTDRWTNARNKKTCSDQEEAEACLYAIGNSANAKRHSAIAIPFIRRTAS